MTEKPKPAKSERAASKKQRRKRQRKKAMIVDGVQLSKKQAKRARNRARVAADASPATTVRACPGAMPPITCSPARSSLGSASQKSAELLFEPVTAS